MTGRRGGRRVARRAGRLAALAGAAAVLLAPGGAAAQEWRATIQAGEVTSATSPAGAGGTSSVALGLSRSGRRDWIGLSAALPLEGDPFWAVLAGTTRVQGSGRVAPLLDLSAHAFLQRRTETVTEPVPGGPLLPPPEPATWERDVSGEGIGGELLGGLRVAGPVAVELRGGVAAQRSRSDGIDSDRVLPTADVRATLAVLPVVLGGEARGWWRGDERWTWAGATVQFLPGPVQLWGSVGSWIGEGPSRASWSAGARAAIGSRLELQATARGNGFDPLYLSTVERALSLGLGVRFGRAPVVKAPVPARYEQGRAELRIRAEDVPRGAGAVGGGAPSIAGDFTGWKPVPMERRGNAWVYRAPLAPGVYHYAFVAADGTWFVPERTPGRRDDGMGGHVAVLVVNE